MCRGFLGRFFLRCCVCGPGRRPRFFAAVAFSLRGGVCFSVVGLCASFGSFVPFTDDEHDLPDRRLFVVADADFLHHARDRRRDLDYSLVGLELQNRLIYGDGLTYGDENPDDRAARDPFTDFG